MNISNEKAQLLDLTGIVIVMDFMLVFMTCYDEILFAGLVLFAEFVCLLH